MSAHDPTRARLAAELDTCQWFALQQMADLEESQGHELLAKGYRWLAQHNKWPASWRPGVWVWLERIRHAGHASALLHGTVRRIATLSDDSQGHFPTASAALAAAAQAAGEWLEWVENSERSHAWKR